MFSTIPILSPLCRAGQSTLGSFIYLFADGSLVVIVVVIIIDFLIQTVGRIVAEEELRLENLLLGPEAEVA